MKNSNFIQTTFLFIALLFAAQANAQWVNSSSIYPSDLSKKVGIGMNNPGYMLHVNGKSGIKASTLTNLTSGGALEILNTDNNQFMTLDGNKIQAAKYTSQFMIGGNALLLNPYLGSVGVGTTSAAEARLVVSGAINQTVAMFGQGAPGISLTNGWPGVGFNAYVGKNASNTLVWKAMSNGFGMRFECDPTSGRVALLQHGYTIANEEVTNAILPFVIESNGNTGMGTNGTSSRLTLGAQDGLSIIGFEPFMTLNDNNSNKSLRIQAAHGDINFIRMSDYGTDIPFVVKDNGNVLIGTPYNDPGYKLAVGGNIICEELKVKLRGNWPDYVFADNYALKPLEEVEQHIKSENHLPGIPAAAEMEKEGITVGDMQVKMMEKIEELTLYLIELKKENKALEARVNALENKH